MSKLPKWMMPLSHSNEFVFNPSTRDFIVQEVPLYEFSGEGEHLVMLIRKKELTTWEMVGILSKYLGIRNRDFGYAGLKDKHAMTLQYVSVLAIYEEKLMKFSHPQIKIITTKRHNNKIRIGHLKGNIFQMRFKKVMGVQRDKLDSVLAWIGENGVPNYFGHQRFGVDGDNWKQGKEIIEGSRKCRDKKMKEFLISAYQSYLFNGWLSRRIGISRLLSDFSEEEVERIEGLPAGSLKRTKRQDVFFKILDGDLMMHYPYGKVFNVEELQEESKRFKERDISPTGLISGKKSKRSQRVAGIIEVEFDIEIEESGSRRYAWVFPDEIKGEYIPQKAHYELEFYLPKGSYATNVVDILKGSMDRQ